MSDTFAKSSPLASARFSTGAMPEIICSVFQPAMPMYSNAFAASVAENCVAAPISRAFLVRTSMAAAASSAPMSDVEIALTAAI